MERQAFAVELAKAQARRSRHAELARRLVQQPEIEASAWQRYLLDRWQLAPCEAWRWQRLSSADYALGSVDRVYAYFSEVGVALLPPSAAAPSVLLELPSLHFPRQPLDPSLLCAALPLISARLSHRDWYSLALLSRDAAALFHGAASPFHQLWAAVRQRDLLPRAVHKAAGDSADDPPAKRQRVKCKAAIREAPPWAQLRRLEAPHIVRVLTARPQLLQRMLPSAQIKVNECPYLIHDCRRPSVCVLVRLEDTQYCLTPRGLFSRLCGYYARTEDLVRMARDAIDQLVNCV